MTTREQAVETLYQDFVALWAARTPYCLGDEDMDPPEAPWVRFTIRHELRTPEAIGQTGRRRLEVRGRVFIQYFAPPGIPDSVNQPHLAHMERAVENRRVGDSTVRFEEAVARELGRIEQGKWWGAVLEAAFCYTDAK